MRNCPAWIVAYMAVLKAGGIATLINGWWQADEMRHALGLAEPELNMRLPVMDEDRALWRRRQDSGRRRPGWG